MEKRINILKTYKLFIGGQFPRTESGRYYLLKSKSGEHIANICQASRKDFRNAVVAARNAFGSWSKKTAYNRSQILYRLAEMLEGRGDQFVNELIQQGATKKNAEQEVITAIDRLVYYAGWGDKYQQVFSTVNPVATAHFNFSIPEPTGVVAIITPDQSPLLSLVTLCAPAILGGNTCIILTSETQPLTASTFAEVINSSDVPGGVVNILTGYRKELSTHFASHMDVNTLIYAGDDKEELKMIQQQSINNVKRVVVPKVDNWYSEKAENPYLVLDTQEIKTTWHPVGI